MNKSNALTEIIDYFGEDHQKMKAIEELSELNKAICKNDIENIKEEMADVYVMLLQLELIYDIDKDELTKIREAKIKRTLDRIRPRINQPVTVQYFNMYDE